MAEATEYAAERMAATAHCQCQRCGQDFALIVREMQHEDASSPMTSLVARGQAEATAKQRMGAASARHAVSNLLTAIDAGSNMAGSEHSLLDATSDCGSYYYERSGLFVGGNNSIANGRQQLSSRDGQDRSGLNTRDSRGLMAERQASNNPGGMDESFVVLSSSTNNSGTSRVHQTSAQSSPNSHERSSDAGGREETHEFNVSVSRRMNALEKLFDFVETEGEIEAPLCLQCSAFLRKELEDAIVEAESDAVEYENAVEVLEKERLKQLETVTKSKSDTKSADDAAVMTETEACAARGTPNEDTDERWRRRFSKLTEQMKALDKESASLDVAEQELSALEDRYWQDYNDYMFQLQQHRHTRDAVLARIEVTTAALEELRQTNVFNDVFHIWHNGPFGTISGFRLGRIGINGNGSGAHTSSTVVEWDEINAAWGQCVLLLSTMASSCKFTFTSYRLLPMGSYSKVIDDRKNTLELFGPISSLNPFKRTNFDRAMVGFLRCLQELADFASTTDKAAMYDDTRQRARQTESDANDHGSAKSGKPFSLPYKIDGDKISGKTIKLTFNREDKWTAALKLMLANLKCLLVWVARHNSPCR